MTMTCHSLFDVQFERELVSDSNLEFSEGDTELEQEENPTSEAVKDLLSDKIDLCNNVHNLKPKAKIKRISLNKKTTLKLRIKSTSLGDLFWPVKNCLLFSGQLF